jgi:hypothetical protein
LNNSVPLPGLHFGSLAYPPDSSFSCGYWQ